MSDSQSHTKEKIMDVARVLFAERGYEGTSVREIAKLAEVNIAAINYHFSSKENLFSAILNLGYKQCSEEMRRMYDQDNPNLEETLIHLFRYFLIKSHDLISYFKLIMSTQHSHQITAQGTEDEMIGPPGGQVLITAILKEVGREVDLVDLHWGLKTLFSHVVHHSLMLQCCFKDNPSIPFCSVEELEAGIRRLSKVVVDNLRASNKSLI